MDNKNRFKPQIWESFSLEEVEFSIFDGPPVERAPQNNTGEQNYKEAYFRLSQDIRTAVCWLEEKPPENGSGRQPAALAAVLKAALKEAERKLLSHN